MKNTIKYIAYLIKKAKENKEPKPIILLGAGASATAGIPLTKVIVRHVKLKYKDNPVMQQMIADNVTDYYKIMQALTSDERKDLFYYYITRKKVKINVTNIYLAQLLKEGFIDYILTVNFDDLILRACALFNFLPPVYDISNIKLPTTSNYREKSVIYLHGQHYGQWLLNNTDELEKVKEDVSNVFKEIKTKRTWIVVGYSGQDEIFNQLVNLGSFSNELFWVNYLNSEPEERVTKELLDKTNTNTHLINGYDSDSFFLKLHTELDINTPDIFNKPFSFLKDIISNVKDIEEHKQNDDNTDLYKNLSERMEISKNWIDMAISDIQEEDSVEKFKQEIIEAYLKENFDKEELFLEKIKKPKFKIAKEDLADFYLVWGTSIADISEPNNSEKLFLESIEKYKKAIELNPEYDKVYYNWGTSISKLAILKNSENLFLESFQKYKKAIKINPEDDNAYNNWGSSISELAKLNNNEKLFLESFEKFKKAIEINPKHDKAYYNWGNSIADLAKLKNNEKLFLESFEKYKKTIEINPKNDKAYHNWGNSISELAHLKKDPSLLKEAVVVLKKGYDLGGSAYNLSCAYALLKDKENALKYLKETLTKNEITKDHVLKDEDWKGYLKDKDFITLLQEFN